MKKQSLIFGIILIVTFMSPFINSPTYEAMGADGATGSLEASANQVFSETLVTFHMASLTVSADYTLDFTGSSATQTNFTTGSKETSKDFTVKLSKPSSGNTVTVTLESQSDGVALDTIVVIMREGSDLVPSDFLLDIMAPLMIIAIVAVLVGSMIKISSNKSGN